MKFSHQIPPPVGASVGAMCRIPRTGHPGLEGCLGTLIIHVLCGGVSKPGRKPGVRFSCAQLCSSQGHLTRPTLQ